MPEPTPTPKAERLNLDGFIRRFHDAHLKMPQRSYCWILGAGCSVTSGIAAGGKLAASWLDELYEDEKQPGESKEAYFARLPQLLQDIGWPVSGFDPTKPATHYSEIYAYRFRGDPNEGARASSRR